MGFQQEVSKKARPELGGFPHKPDPPRQRALLTFAFWFLQYTPKVPFLGGEAQDARVKVMGNLSEASSWALWDSDARLRRSTALSQMPGLGPQEKWFLIEK